MTTPDISWGETPLDKLSQPELLRAAQRLYSALTAARATMKWQSGISPDDLYWHHPAGSGNQALEKAKQAIAAVDGERDEPAYSGFYRYADTLLFEGIGTGGKWTLCPVCRLMTKNIFPAQASLIGAPCEKRTCNGTQREITWEDLQPLDS